MKVNLLSLFLTVSLSAIAQSRQETTLTEDWSFSMDQKTWQTVRVPHDWAIAGPFDKKWDLQNVAIEQNGETEATEKSGRSGALPWIGEGYYKRIITIPEGCSHAELLFDGAMAEPKVYLNGELVGEWAYGYNTFRVDISGTMKTGDNLLEVHLKNVEESSRWYPGAGIYRPVKLITTGDDYLDPWATYIRTISIDSKKAIIDMMAGIGSDLADGQDIEVELHDADGRIVGRQHDSELSDGGAVYLTFNVENPHLWTPETPYLYNAVIKYTKNGKMMDQISQKFGIRTVKISKEGGFQLNGVTRKIKGVCLHHDLGPLGAAINKSALIRQIKMMKEMGCDAIRTSHNMPSQMQMDICDSLGMMVMAESFDMWVYPKCKNGYARFFKDWWYKDIEHLILANRNHPSIIMWSIGNEIPEQGSAEGKELSEQLQEACHRLDSTRYVTQGLDHAEASIESGVAKLMDVPGFNYRVHKYGNSIQQLPQGFLLGSETASTVSSRGVYKFPVVPDDNSRYASWVPGYDPKAILNADGQCSSYDMEYCSWSNLPDDDWVWQDDKDWVIGEFVWTGYDYLGEPSPYDEYWPSRSSYFGICDLAGLPKDRYYLYRSHWNKDAHTIHLLPHWSWGTSKKDKGNRIGKVTPVFCYTDYPTGELFVNGKSQGKITKNPTERLDRYRLRWNNVKYEPGEIKVVVYDEQGNKAGEQIVKTAGKPAALKLDTWTANGPLKADGDDLAFITVSLTDADGTLIPEAADQLTFEVSGAGSFEAVCNGDATSLESFKAPTMKLFNGQLVVVVRSAKTPGTLTLKVTDETLHLSATTTIQTMAITPWKKGAFETGQYRNLFVEMGYNQADVDAKLKEVFNDVFRGPNKVYFEVGDSLGYISDIKNNDARTEGMSYGMMIAVQFGEKDIFDRLWRWSKKYMQHQDGNRKGYFAWSCKTDGTHNAEGAASDGELYFITALLFASNRWGNDTGINYKAEAQHILDCIQPKEYEPEPMPRFPGFGPQQTGPQKMYLIDPETKLITFTPDGFGQRFTDPSYHIPAFYEVWAKWADDGRSDYWKECAVKSREYLHKAINEQTGLNPDMSQYDGSEMQMPRFPGMPQNQNGAPRRFGSNNFRYDSWRVPMNITLDYEWSCADGEWQRQYGEKIQNFFYSQGVDKFVDQYRVDGSLPEDDEILPAGGFRKLRHSIGLVATTAAASMLCSHDKSKEFVDALWNAKHEPFEDGYFDAYYDGLLRLFAFMHLSGNYRVILPK